MKMNCYKCDKLGYFAAQCQIKPQGFQQGQYKKRPSHVKTIQNQDPYLESDQMTAEELQEQMKYEENAECRTSIEGFSQYEETDWREKNIQSSVDLGVEINY